MKYVNILGGGERVSFRIFDDKAKRETRVEKTPTRYERVSESNACQNRQISPQTSVYGRNLKEIKKDDISLSSVT